MLQVTENGANITLSGKAQSFGDGIFWFAVALMFGAVAVAMAMSILPERLAIGALALLVVFSFVFNLMRNRQKSSQTHIGSGILKVQYGMFVHNQMGKTQRILVKDEDVISVNAKELVIKDNEGKIKCQVTGFDNEKEAKVMQAILQGQQFSKRNANIKMQSS